MKTLQIRSVPDDVHRKLKVRAAQVGMSLSELALSELLRSLERPMRSELLDRLGGRSPVDIQGVGGAAAMVRAERDAR